MRSPVRSIAKAYLCSHFAQTIRNKRKSLNMTQVELAGLIGYATKQNVGNWEREASIPPVGVLYLTAIALNLPIEDLFPSIEEFKEKAGLTMKEISLTRIVLTDESSEPSQ